MHKFLTYLLSAALLITLTACRSKNTSESSELSDNSKDPVNDATVISMEIDKEVASGTVDNANNCSNILFSGNSASADTGSVSISGSKVTILDEGKYIVTGSTDNGMIIVNADKSDKVEIILNGAGIISKASAAIYVYKADKLTVTLADGSKNYLANGGSYTAIDENNIDAVIFSKEDLSLEGTGNLNIEAKDGHGIVSKDDLKIKEGKYTIIASGHGISGKDSVNISGGVISVTSQKDGIKAKNEDDTLLGNIVITNGNIKIDAKKDGISAGGTLTVDGGSFDITSGGGSKKSTTNTDESAKGIKAVSDLNVNNGIFSLNCADDAIHSNLSVMVSGGSITAATGDDGIHADVTTSVTGGTLNITESYEGIEGQTVNLSGGTIHIVSSDDGINAAGGADNSGTGGIRGGDMFGKFGRGTMGGGNDGSDNYQLNISGGKIYINANGDGIDSNGALTVSGGEVYVSGPTNGGNGAIDYGTNARISGGIVIAAGASGMAENFGSESTQGSMLINTGNQNGGEIRITDSDGNLLASYTAEKTYATVVISCPGLKIGSTYKVTAGNYSQSVTLSSLITGSDNSGMGGMGRPEGGKGGFH